MEKVMLVYSSITCMKSVCFQHYGFSSVVYWSWSNISANIAGSLFKVNEARGGMFWCAGSFRSCVHYCRRSIIMSL